VEISTERSDELTTPQQQTFVELFRNSPPVEAELDFERVPDYCRDIHYDCSREIASLALSVAQRVWQPDYRNVKQSAVQVQRNVPRRC
jgi:hypothetical protein